MLAQLHACLTEIKLTLATIFAASIASAQTKSVLKNINGAQITATFQADNKHLSASGNLIEAQPVETSLLIILP